MVPAWLILRRCGAALPSRKCDKGEVALTLVFVSTAPLYARLGPRVLSDTACPPSFTPHRKKMTTVSSLNPQERFSHGVRPRPLRAGSVPAAKHPPLRSPAWAKRPPVPLCNQIAIRQNVGESTA